jgi:competence protein ComEC
MKSPLLALAACFALGIVVARPEWGWVSGPTWLLVAAGACLVAGVVILRVGVLRISFLLALAGFVAAGAAASRLFENRFPPYHVSHLARLGVDLEDAVRLEGRLVSDPERTAYGLQFDLETRRVESRGRAHAVTGRIRLRLQVPDDAESLALAEDSRLRYGDSIRTLVLLRKPRVYQNPGSFDFRRWLEAVQDVSWAGSIKSPHVIEKIPGNAPKLGALLHAVRRRLLQGIDRLYPPWSAEGRYGAIAKAVLLGDRSSLDSDTIESFRRTGLYHLLVISGLHVGLLALLAALVLRRFPLSESWRTVLVLVLLCAYTALVELRAPTLRATLMISAYLVGRLLYRERSLLNAVGLAALALLVYRPAWLWESGFQLSFSAALVIAGLAVPILARTTEPYRRALWNVQDVDWDASLAPRQAQFRLSVRKAMAGLQARLAFFQRHPTLAASAVTAPPRMLLWAANILLFSAILQFALLLPMAETFHRVTYAGIALNALAIPLMTLLLALGVPTMLLGATLPGLGAWLAKVTALVMQALLTLTDLPGLPAWLSYRVAEPPLWVSVAFALSLVATAWAVGRRRRLFWISLAASVILGVVISLHPFSPRLPVGEIAVTALDCGGGDAIFVVLPDRTTLLVDGGGAREGAFRGRRWDAGEEIVSPYLWAQGVKRVDVVVLTHAHEDHLGGLAAIFRNFRVGEFWHGSNPPTPAYLALLEEAERRGVRSRQVAAGERILLGGASVEILWPSAAQPGLRPPSNDDSVVMRITSGEASLLLTGDISEAVEEELLRSGAPLSSHVLKVAHHGAGSSSCASFLARVSPQVALVSVESRNPNNLPNPATLARLRLAGTRVYRTDLDGAVTAEMRGPRLSVRAYGVPSAP